jgi:Sigma-70, region 4
VVIEYSRLGLGCEINLQPREPPMISPMMDLKFAVQWLAYTLPCQRFTCGLATDPPMTRGQCGSYSFTVIDLHHLLLAGLPAHLALTPHWVSGFLNLSDDDSWQVGFRRRDHTDRNGGGTLGNEDAARLCAPPEQYARLDFEDFRKALAHIPLNQREALLLVGAEGLSYEEAAQFCEWPSGRSRVASTARAPGSLRCWPSSLERSSVPIRRSGLPFKQP